QALPPPRPNIVFILSDDLGWADTELYGKTKLYKTPNLLRLAKRGMVFSRAYSASPLCSPTRASILTGQSPARIGITAPNCHLPEVKLAASVQKNAPTTAKALQCESATRLNTSYVTLAETLQSAGYATAHFGKWHLGAAPYSPLEQGFDIDLPHTPGPGPAGSFVAPWKFPNFKERTPAEHIEDRMSDEAVAWMTKNKDKPFFLNYWQFSVHAPFDAKKSLIEKYKGRVDPKDPQHSPTYAAMVESMDDSVGKLLDALDRLGIADKTAIVFLADNGGNMYNMVDGTTPTSNAPLRGGKATVYEGGIRVPCVVSWPKVTKPGSRNNEAIIQSTDFYPTILELLKLKPESNQIFDGRSIASALLGKPLTPKPIFTYFPHSPKVPDSLPPAVTVHSGDWKLIRLFHQGEKGAHAYQLYNLKDDLSEAHDLAASQPERVKHLDALIEGFLKDTKAIVPLPNPAYDAKARPTTQATPIADPLEGRKARGCEATVENGIVTITGAGPTPFLGFAAWKLGGPTVVSLRVRSIVGGAGKVEWLPTPQDTDKAKSVAFTLKASAEWQEVTVALPAEGALGILRLYLPAQKESLMLDWIEIKPTQGKPQRWSFDK
ncbi:sulfatase, partial [Armatimonas sp.]|uniref:sulfatase n=1 Tax=Armatimonas sp. TaxID=1872638 RepID=UPI00375175C4